MAQETEYDFNHIGTEGWLVIVAVFLFVIWKVWPELKANNIFMNNSPYPNYAENESAKKNRLYTPSDAMVMCILFSTFNIFVFLIDNDKPIGSHFNYPTHPRNPFISSLSLLIGTYIYSFIEESDFSKLRDFRFAARAWLSTILICSVPFFIYELSHGIIADVAIFHLFFTARLMNDAGIIIFAVTLYATNYFSRKTWKIARKKKMIIISAGTAALVTAVILYLVLSSVLLVIICLFFAVILIGGLLFYKMTPVVYSDETDTVAENADAVSG